MLAAVGDTVVLLHGFTQTGAAWRGVAGVLGESYRAVAPDLRGHGAAAAERPVSFDAVLGDVAAAAPERFVLCGYSLGGRLALMLALAHPRRVERLVLLGASPGIAEPQERRRRLADDEALAQRIEREGVAAFSEHWGALGLWAGQPPAARALAEEMRAGQDAAGLAAALRGLSTGAMPALWDRLGELAMPVTCAAGERDGRYLEVARRMAARIPEGRFASIPGAGHAAHLEAPAAVAALLAP